MSKSWDDVFKKQSKEAANFDLCWIDSRKQEKIRKIIKTPMYGSAAGGGFAMTTAVIKK